MVRDLDTLAGEVLNHVTAGTLSDAMVREFTKKCSLAAVGEEKAEWGGSLQSLWSYVAVGRSVLSESGLGETDCFLCGRLYAAMEIVNLACEQRQADFDLKTDAKEYSQHWYRVFEALKDGRSLTHRDLAQQSNLSAFSLSQFLHRIEDKRYIHYSEAGRIKYYRLSSRGQQLFQCMEGKRLQPPCGI